MDRWWQYSVAYPTRSGRGKVGMAFLGRGNEPQSPKGFLHSSHLNSFYWHLKFAFAGALWSGGYNVIKSERITVT